MTGRVGSIERTEKTEYTEWTKRTGKSVITKMKERKENWTSTKFSLRKAKGKIANSITGSKALEGNSTS